MRSFWTIGMGFVAGSAMTVLGAAGVASAAADEPSTLTPASADRAREADARAADARARADALAAQGGQAYKSGAVDRANAEAAYAEADAQQARAAVTGANMAPYAVSPTMAAAQADLEALKAQGGQAYKSGAVSRAEADIASLKGPPPAVTQEAPPATWNKPIVQTMREQAQGGSESD
jgi:hypothetical protein